jgi:hypothetical protein
MDVTISALLYWSSNSMFVRILHPFVSLFELYTFLKIFLSHTLRASSICSNIVHPSQPYVTISMITVLYIFRLTLCRRSESNCYLRIQSVPQREHHTSPLQRSAG